jgi:hypothetical protein
MNLRTHENKIFFVAKPQNFIPKELSEFTVYVHEFFTIPIHVVATSSNKFLKTTLKLQLVLTTLYFVCR